MSEEFNRLKRSYPQQIITRAYDYTDRVVHCVKKENCLVGNVVGSSKYRTDLDLDTLKGECSCPYGFNCKHAVALYLVYLKGEFVDGKKIYDILNRFEKDELVSILMENIENLPKLSKKLLCESEHSKSFDDYLERVLKVEEFSYRDVEELEDLYEEFSFDELYQLYVFLSENFDYLKDKIFDELEEAKRDDFYFHYDDLTDSLAELFYDVQEQLFKSVQDENQFMQLLEFSDGFVKYVSSNALEFREYKDVFKEFCLERLYEEEYFNYLLSLDNTSIKEVLECYKEDFLVHILELPKKNFELASRLVDEFENRVFWFLYFLEKKNLVKSLEYFEAFDKLKMNKELFDFNWNFITPIFNKDEYVHEFVLLLKEAEHFDKDLELYLFEKYFASKLYQSGFIEDEAANYLISRIDDVCFLKRFVDMKEDFSISKVLLEKIAKKDLEVARNVFFQENGILANLHCDRMVEIVDFCHSYFGKDDVRRLLVENINNINNSHFKSRLRNKGITVSVRKRKMNIEFN